MEPVNNFKMTYYIGAMLAQGGILTIKENSLVFFPGTIEKAVGAQDTIIPFEKIKMVEVTGTITESLMIRTMEKAHRFVGSDLYKIRDIINSMLANYQPQHPVDAGSAEVQLLKIESSATQVPVRANTQTVGTAQTPKVSASPKKCPSCSGQISPEFHFCPFCKAVLSACCPGCHRSVTTGWKFCAFCGSDLTA